MPVHLAQSAVESTGRADDLPERVLDDPDTWLRSVGDTIDAWAQAHEVTVGGIAMAAVAVGWLVHRTVGLPFARRALDDADDDPYELDYDDDGDGEGSGGRVPRGGDPEEVWREADREYRALCEQYTAFETDLMELVRVPSLADVAFGPTAAFHERFYEAVAMATETRPADHRVRQFADAVSAAVVAWTAAREAAERARTSRFTPQEQVLLRRVRRSLALAESDTDPGERANAYRLVATWMGELEASAARRGSVWVMPTPLRSALDAWTPPPGLAAGPSAAREDDGVAG